MKRAISIAGVGLLLLAACGSDDDSGSSSETTETTEAQTVEGALATFCEEGDGYVDALDVFGMVFDDSGATVGDLREGVQPLIDAGEAAQAAGADLSDAVEAQEKQAAEDAEAAEEAGEEPPTTLVTVEVSDDLIEQVQSAQGRLEAALEGVEDDTTLETADVALTSSAYELEVSWVTLLLEAGCVEDEGAARELVRQYVAAIQTDLTTANYYSGKIDGVWGTTTADAVKALQAANGLPESGFLDPLSQEALAEELAGQESAQTAALQGLLISTGFYDGAVDGQWSDELEAALKEFQTALGLPATGEIDENTLRAFQERLAAGEEALNATTTAPETTEAPQPTEAEETTTTAAG